MKKIMINMIFVGLISIMVFPLCVSAKDITTLETAATRGEVTISGTTEDGVLAVAALVYSGSDLVYMETCDANGSAYSCTLDNDFADGDYVVKVADYDGGDYAVDNISVSDSAAANPETADSTMLSIIIGSMALIGLLGTGFYLKKRNA